MLWWRVPRFLCLMQVPLFVVACGSAPTEHEWQTLDAAIRQSCAPSADCRDARPAAESVFVDAAGSDDRDLAPIPDGSFLPPQDARVGEGGAAPPSDSAVPEDSSPPASFFSMAEVSEHPTLVLPGDGDLWPSCWSDDDNVYAAWGDGWGFNQDKRELTDIGVARLTGSPRDGSLTGVNIAVGNAVGQVWTQGQYARKPTGMVCVGGDLYLAVQDLSLNFSDAPAATIARSRDKGRTWEWERAGPMFRDHQLTTIFFLDFGKDGEHAIDSYVYAYGLDGNWRDSFSDEVPDPTQLWLLRVPRSSIQDRARWEWFSGLDASASATWSFDASARQPVLDDSRRLYSKTTPRFGPFVSNLSVLSQGSVVYDAPLKRFLYTSWTEYTFEFYEAPTPWGPFVLFLSKDYGGYPWSTDKMGGYATTLPSKFISSDGHSAFVQANTFTSGVKSYSFSLRELSLQPNVPSVPENVAGEAIPTGSESATVIGTSFHAGRPDFLRDGVIGQQSEDSYTGEAKTSDFWGYTWGRSYSLNSMRYTTGQMLADCGWFETLGIQVRRNGTWTSVEGLTTSPPYPGSNAAGEQRSYTLRFETAAGDGVRLIGRPGGSGACTSIAELAVGFLPP